MVGGSILIGAGDAGAENVFFAVDPGTGEQIGPYFMSTCAVDIQKAYTLASDAFDAFGTSPEDRALIAALVVHRKALNTSCRINGT